MFKEVETEMSIVKIFISRVFFVFNHVVFSLLLTYFSIMDTDGIESLKSAEIFQVKASLPNDWGTDIKVDTSIITLLARIELCFSNIDL